MKIFYKLPDGTWQFGLPGFCLCKGKGFVWFRIFGYGLNIQDRSIHRALFSERNGFSKALIIGKYSIKTLKRWK